MADSGPSGAGGAGWKPVAYGAPDGVRVELWRSLLPDKLVDQLENDLAGLRQRAAEETAACGGRLIDAFRVRAAGRPALLRLEQLLDERQQTEMYVASLLVVLDDEVLVEVTITCGGPGGGDLAEEVGVTPLARVLAAVEQITPGIRFPAPWG